MDSIDKEILSIIQEDVSIPLSTIAKKVNLSTTPCFNRIKRMEEDGIITKKVALLNPKKIDLPLTIFLTISVAIRNPELLKDFINLLTSRQEVVGLYRLTGEADYLVKVVASSLEQYDEFSQEIIKEIEFETFNSYIVLKELKETTVLPIINK